jgi:hypothetical protein
MGEKAAAVKIRECFSIADQIVTAAPKVGRFQAGERLIVVVSDFYGSYWLSPRESRGGKYADRKDPSDLKPLEALTEALGWLKSHRVGKRKSISEAPLEAPS